MLLIEDHLKPDLNNAVYRKYVGFGIETILFKWFNEFCASYSGQIYLILPSLPIYSYQRFIFNIVHK